MTEKRFILTETSYIYDTQDKGICPTLESVVKVLNELHEENKELKEINQDYISSLEEEKNNLQIKLQKIRDYAMEDGEVKQGVIEKVMCE